MESHAIKKPSASDSLPAQGRQTAPVIIYDASPKVIHAEPSEFMALVQLLTGPAGSVGAPPPPPPHEVRHLQADDTLPPELLLSPSAAMSPAARLATIERSVRPMPDDDGTLAAVLGPAHPGVLSPLPFDVSSLSWINELSPILRAAAGSTSSPRRRPPARSSSAACRTFSSSFFWAGSLV
jgi:MAP kinase substrate 1